MSTATFLNFVLFTLFPITIFISFLYLAWFNADGRHSLGKKLLGLAVVDTSFKPIPFSRSIWRTLAFIFDIPGLFLIFFNRKKQTLHDMLAKTYVIRIKKPHRLEKLLIIMVFIGAVTVEKFLAGYTRSYIQSFRLPTGSLKPTILVGDYILVDKFWAKSHTPEQGDWIVFKYPKDEKLNYIKRCIAVGGQTLEIRKGEVYVNGESEGQKLSLGREYDPEEGRYVENTKIMTSDGNSYVIRHYADHNLYDDNHNFGPFTVPKGHYFVIGDSRDNSADSRTWGSVPQENIVGKAGIIYWSWDKWNRKIRWSRIGKALH
jgi:signal peptidase I